MIQNYFIEFVYIMVSDECNKLLGIGSFQEHDDKPFCKTCYGKLFGPKGYGFAGGSAGLSSNRDDENDSEVQMRLVSLTSRHSRLVKKCALLSILLTTGDVGIAW